MQNSLVKNIAYKFIRVITTIIIIVVVFLLEEFIAGRLHVLYNKRDIMMMLEQKMFTEVNLIMLIHISFVVIAFMYSIAMNLSQLKWWRILMATLLLICLFFMQLNNGNMFKPYNMHQEQIRWIQLSVIIGILITIFVFFLIIIAQRDFNYQLKKQILRLGMHHSRTELEQIERSYINTRILKHDMKHLLVVILSLVKRGDYSTAEKKIEDVIGKQLVTDTVHLQSNILINAVINNKINICKENNIFYEVKYIGEISMEQEMNVAIALSNLFDNAIEAALKEKERVIHLDMFPVKDMYSIVISNKLSQSVLENNSDLKTTKDNVYEHGLGKVSVGKVVNQMKGIYENFEEDGYFISTIMFPNE